MYIDDILIFSRDRAEHVRHVTEILWRLRKHHLNLTLDKCLFQQSSIHRHWLEGAVHPFLVLTDHRNLEYLCEAKRLNSHQARWELFFTRYNFTITYRPGTQNGPADDLSRQYSSNHVNQDPESILPPAIFVSPVLWAMDEEISASTHSFPPGSPDGKT